MPAHRSQLVGYGLPLPPAGAATAGGRTSKVAAVLARYRPPAGPRPVGLPPPPRPPAGYPRPVSRRAAPPLVKIRQKKAPAAETSDPRQILDLIGSYARGRRTVVISYRKETANGQVVTRECEPYSIRYKMTQHRGRRRYAMLFCLPHSGIHSFIVDNILSVKGTNRRFVPRWRVEF